MSVVAVNCTLLNVKVYPNADNTGGNVNPPPPPPVPVFINTTSLL